jgi:hypothetical protein
LKVQRGVIRNRNGSSENRKSRVLRSQSVLTRIN